MRVHASAHQATLIFHNTGPVTENALSPYVFVLGFGTFSRFLVEERKVLVLLRGTNNSLM